MSWNFRTLDSLLNKSGSDRAGNRDYPVLSITMRDGLVDQSEKFKKRVASQDTSKYRIAYRNELVVGFPIDEGVLGFQTKYPAGIVSPAYDIWKLKEPSAACIPYIERYLRSAQARRIYASKMQGAVARRRSLTKEDFLKLEVPFPLLDDQKRIAHLLGKVEGLIAQRKQHLQQLDDLLKSVFLEMFGDPVRNEKRWDTGSLSTYGSFKNGLNFGKGESGASVRYLGVGDFKSKAMLDNIDDLAFIELNEAPSAEYFLHDGDLLFVRSNGNRELVGRCMAVYPKNEKVTYSGFIIRYRIDDPALQPTYIAHLFRSFTFRRVLFQGGQGANIQNINQQILSSLPIPLPSEDLQTQFAAIVEKVEGLKSRYQQSLADLEAFYCALTQKAFKGELDLSRVPLEPATIKDNDSLEVEGTAIEASFEAPDNSPVNTPEGRIGFLKRCFSNLLAVSRSDNLLFSDFEQEVQLDSIRMWGEDNFIGELTFAEYDLFKEWLFEAINTGLIEQTRNPIEVDDKPDFGNQIILRRRGSGI